VVVVVGGADGMDAASERAARVAVREVVLPVISEAGGILVDGGTDSGVMRVLGELIAEANWAGALLGVAVGSLVDVTGGEEGTAVEPHHTHLLLVPGRDWGDESAALSTVAGEVAGDHGSVTVVINGGDVTRSDVGMSVAAGRPVLAVAGTGRLADDLVAEAQSRKADGVAVLGTAVPAAEGRRLLRGLLSAAQPSDSGAAPTS
jgi:hypothetical protein